MAEPTRQRAQRSPNPVPVNERPDWGVASFAETCGCAGLAVRTGWARVKEGIWKKPGPHGYTVAESREICAIEIEYKISRKVLEEQRAA